MYNGVINIRKEKDYTSFDVVAKLRGILKQKKIGHTGTLDPLAEGVLLVCLGNATKLADLLTCSDKEYETVMLLGKTTDTEDITGNLLSENSINVSEDEVISAVMSFVGDYMQIPPMYSAIKKNGKKLYEYAREGIEIEREARKVSIFSINILDVSLPEVTFKVHCSKGTYIRSLCRDIGEKLGTGAVMKSLTRREVNGFNISDSFTLDKVQELMDTGEIETKILPTDSLLNDYPEAHIKEGFEKALLNGNKLKKELLILKDKTDFTKLEEGLYVRVYLGDEFKALYLYDKENGCYKPYKMFLEK